MILNKILDYCKEIDNTHNVFKRNIDLFFDKENGYIYRNSLAMSVLQIGELAKRLSDDIRINNKHIPWKEIMGMRDIFAHHYGSLDFESLWTTTNEEISELRTDIEKLLYENGNE